MLKTNLKTYKMHMIKNCSKIKKCKKIQKKHFIIFNLFFVQILFSQVGIGTTNPSSSSALEIKSANSGLLIPRIALNSTSDITTVPNPAISLLVYNTNTVNNVTPGFYYWEGSWKRINNSAPAWELSGNTLSGSEYLGTNNLYPLLFKVSPTRRNCNRKLICCKR